MCQYVALSCVRRVQVSELTADWLTVLANQVAPAGGAGVVCIHWLRLDWFCLHCSLHLRKALVHLGLAGFSFTMFKNDI